MTNVRKPAVAVEGHASSLAGTKGPDRERPPASWDFWPKKPWPVALLPPTADREDSSRRKEPAWTRSSWALAATSILPSFTRIRSLHTPWPGPELFANDV